MSDGKTFSSLHHFLFPFIYNAEALIIIFFGVLNKSGVEFQSQWWQSSLYQTYSPTENNHKLYTKYKRIKNLIIWKHWRVTQSKLTLNGIFSLERREKIHWVRSTFYVFFRLLLLSSQARVCGIVWAARQYSESKVQSYWLEV